MNQEQVEDKYSRKNIRRHIMSDVDVESAVFKTCEQLVEKYLNGVYYKSKQLRVDELKEGKLSIQDIVLELCIAILPIAEISPIQAMAVQIGNRLGFKHLLDAVKTGSELIAVCEKSGLYTIFHSVDHENETGTLGVRPNFKLSDEVLEFINLTMYLPPMICEPRDWHNNIDGGYLEGSGSVILGAINHHMMKQDLDSLNYFQKIPWELNRHMLGYQEQPNKLLDTDEKIQQFNRFVQESFSVYQQLLATGNHFYFVWKYDKRGRMYSQGYHVNLQSTKYKKAILQFKNKEVLT